MRARPLVFGNGFEQMVSDFSIPSISEWRRITILSIYRKKQLPVQSDPFL